MTGCRTGSARRAHEMMTVNLIQGRVASLETFSRGCQALGNTNQQGPQDSVSILGARDGLIRLIDCDENPNLRLGLENDESGQTSLILSNPGQTDSPTVAIPLGIRVPAEDGWLSPEGRLRPGVKQLSIRPEADGVAVEVVTMNTSLYYFSSAGVQEPSIAACSTLNIRKDWTEAARQALNS